MKMTMTSWSVRFAGKQCHSAVMMGLGTLKAYSVRETVSKELHQNHLALCPVCAAKYKWVNSTEPTKIRTAIRTFTEPNNNADAVPFEVEVTLAKERHCIRFVADHFHDLQAILAEATEP